ncbi:MAG TPA: hypothetical protein DCR63_06620 [Microbacterium sp.]|nr:hypothetical protein [Microbacterium sp.]
MIAEQGDAGPDLTVVTVVFGPEVDLLELQARSMARFLAPVTATELIILDNGVRALSSATQRRLRRAYGPLGRFVKVIRTADLIDAGGARGWRSQQAAKLAIARHITTSHYVVLDAKNHLTRTADVSAFIGSDGRAHGAFHTYRGHPLRPSLERTLDYLGASPEQKRDAVESFPPTATPFVFDTALVRAMLDDIERRDAVPFFATFEREQLLEFFLYSGWVMTRGPGITEAIDGKSIPSPTVWPKAADLRGVIATIAEAEREGAFVFAVHRQVLARGDAATLNRIAEHWVRSELFTSLPEAKALIRRFRRRYFPALVVTRLAERLGRHH